MIIYNIQFVLWSDVESRVCSVVIREMFLTAELRQIDWEMLVMMAVS